MTKNVPVIKYFSFRAIPMNIHYFVLPRAPSISDFDNKSVGRRFSVGMLAQAWFRFGSKVSSDSDVC